MSAENAEELPEGWASATLPEVFRLNPPKPKSDDYDDDTPVSFVPMPAVDAVSGTIQTPSVRPFAEVRKGFTAFRNGDIILAKITPCMENGKAAIVRDMVNGLGFGSTEFHVFRATGAVLPEYLFQFVRQDSFRRDAAAEMTGSVGQKRVPVEYILLSAHLGLNTSDLLFYLS
jgi:type I restriction enzyme, S subunit